MTESRFPDPRLLTFPDAERSPLSIRAKALVFIDPRSRRLRERVEQLAATPLPVLIVGETGTGKELLARHLHGRSERGGLFVPVSCGAISATRGEAELFGYSMGAHRASAASRAGWFGSANGGTLYLDEIGDLPLGLQASLLAALESGETRRVGASRAMPVDVRLIAATSIDLALAVEAGKFDESLYRYLRAAQVDLPPLRERPGDILPLAEYFLGIHAQRLGLTLPLIGDAAQRVLERHSWPGNTRELENVIHFALLVSRGETLLPEHFNLPEPLTQLETLLARLQTDPDRTRLLALQHLLRQADARLTEALR
ncbi:sigma-54-dependent Fis family transcriptional regulator [Stutzerimonas nosocomialis]|uniref:sigma 54-interacting transcriptional regulator n=1 Tax=Stutzerimonas nosocomialis TaxID=1056496 RepID=UPI0011082589|nr:sigma 54-interacting transcriptional regulator [Stutzerimonas nosocomialis]TLX58527.1 sigma-54-dependent Fis family transcriptional regulator [Stutzerimonas nosocomialis]